MKWQELGLYILASCLLVVGCFMLAGEACGAIAMILVGLGLLPYEE